MGRDNLLLDINRCYTLSKILEQFLLVLVYSYWNSFQFLGSLMLAATHWCTPEPRLPRVVAFKLFSRYPPQTISSRVMREKCTLMYGMKEPAAYSEKVHSVPGLTMLITAAPSIMTTFQFLGI